MKRFRCCRAAAILLSLVPFAVPAAPLHAAGGHSKLVPPGRLVIDGRRLTCGNTPTLLRNFDGISMSSNVIVLNMSEVKRFPRRVQWLIYYHECGHIRLGPSETEADCYAVRRAQREGWLNSKTLRQICAVFNIVGHGPVHPDPAVRCRDLHQCLLRHADVSRNAH